MRRGGLHPVLLAAMMVAGPAFGQDETEAEVDPAAEAEAAAIAAQAETDAEVIHDCAWVLPAEDLPEACMWAVSSACFHEVGDWTAEKAVGCYDREARGWQAWAVRMRGEAEARVPEAALDRIDAAEIAWSAYRDAACAAEGAAFGHAEDGMLAAAKCRMRKAAERAVELRMIGLQ